MWNSYRQCQLHLTDLLSRVNRCLNAHPETYSNSRDFLKLRNEVLCFADDTIASIPFMLIGERINGNKPRASTWVQTRPPMLIGGLNMQWILFTISILEIIPNEVRQKMKIILLWIGKNLGIRQATLLAHVWNLLSKLCHKLRSYRWIRIYLEVSLPEAMLFDGRAFSYEKQDWMDFNKASKSP